MHKTKMASTDMWTKMWLKTRPQYVFQKLSVGWDPRKKKRERIDSKKSEGRGWEREKGGRTVTATGDRVKNSTRECCPESEVSYSAWSRQWLLSRLNRPIVWTRPPWHRPFRYRMSPGTGSRWWLVSPSSFLSKSSILSPSGLPAWGGRQAWGWCTLKNKQAPSIIATDTEKIHQ